MQKIGFLLFLSFVLQGCVATVTSVKGDSQKIFAELSSSTGVVELVSTYDKSVLAKATPNGKKLQFKLPGGKTIKQATCLAIRKSGEKELLELKGGGVSFSDRAYIKRTLNDLDSEKFSKSLSSHLAGRSENIDKINSTPAEVSAPNAIDNYPLCVRRRGPRPELSCQTSREANEQATGICAAQLGTCAFVGMLGGDGVLTGTACDAAVNKASNLSYDTQEAVMDLIGNGLSLFSAQMRDQSNTWSGKTFWMGVQGLTFAVQFNGCMNKVKKTCDRNYRRWDNEGMEEYRACERTRNEFVAMVRDYNNMRQEKARSDKAIGILEGGLKKIGLEQRSLAKRSIDDLGECPEYYPDSSRKVPVEERYSKSGVVFMSNRCSLEPIIIRGVYYYEGNWKVTPPVTLAFGDSKALTKPITNKNFYFYARTESGETVWEGDKDNKDDKELSVMIQQVGEKDLDNTGGGGNYVNLWFRHITISPSSHPFIGLTCS